MEPSSVNEERAQNAVENLDKVLQKLSCNNTSQIKTCISFAKYGHCRFDKNCKYLHQQRNSPNIEFSSDKMSASTSSLKNTPFRRDPVVFGRVYDSGKQIDSRSSQKNNIKKPCKYFLAGRCSKENCNFNHVSINQSSNQFSTNSSVSSICPSSRNKKRYVPSCHYFKRGACLKGDECNYYHSKNISHHSKNLDIDCDKGDQSNNKDSNFNEVPHSKDNLDVSDSKEVDANQPSMVPCNDTTAKCKVPCQVLKIFDLPLSEEEIHKLRKTEITQMKKRFPGCMETQENSVFSFEFSPSDPDWVHDITCFHLQITFPSNYPVEVCKIEVLQSADFIFEKILKHLNKCIYEWLLERHKDLMEMNKVELLFRSFLRWFDKSLNEMFSYCFQKRNSEEQNIPCNEYTTEDNIVNTVGNLKNNMSENKVQAPNSIKTPVLGTHKAQKNGFTISLCGLELIEGVGTLSCIKLDIMLLCRRCKTSVHVKTLPNKNKSMTCSKCSLIMECNFDPSIIHQFSNVLGTVYLVGCTGLDVNLVECAFLVDCLNCSKQVPIEGLHPGSKQKLWCALCNQKFLLSVQSSKFQASSTGYTSIKAEPVKKIERKKDLHIKEGGPLPEFGICKHYKKSNRWFRFPCCGRVYPCDICHEEKEDGHELKFASRIICGFCSKEQPFTKDKPCSGCSAQVTAKSASHWEGGKGCRNKTLMARGDKKKYIGILKTMPKSSQVLKPKKK